jgi:predicted permease
MLLVGAGLLLRSFLRVLDVDLGFRPDRTAALKIDLTDGGDHAKRNPELRAIIDKVTAIPGVESAGVCDMLPLDRNRSWGMQVKGSPQAKARYMNPFVYVVSPGYLETMGMRLTSGRDIGWRAVPGTENEVVINEAAAREGWPGEDPVGRLVSGLADKDSRVVGVISDVHEISPETPSSPEVYLPMAQSDPEGAELVIRTKLPLEVVAPSVMAAVRSLNPGQPLTRFRPIGDIVEHSVSPRRFFAELVSVFAAFGLVLASLGIYGVVSYTVAQQTQDIGIRMALGATPSRVLADVVGTSLGTALVGIAAGGVLSVAMGKLMASLLFATPPVDPVTFAGTVSLLVVVAGIAAFLPARRASSINPIIAIRGK